MGIRFLCPNGHKLNVKAFLAGERGICPQCDAKFLVPRESGGQAEAISEAALAAATEPQADAPKIDTSLAASPSTVPPPPPPEPTSSAPVAATSEPPAEVWYVRTATGEQFGPADQEAMRGWVAEGRVTVDCYVWRTGWPDWKTGGHAITQLNCLPPDVASLDAAPAASPVASPMRGSVEADQVNLPGNLPPPDASGVLPEPTSPTALYQSTKRLRQERARKFTLLLGVVVLILFAVLVAVLVNNSK